MMRKLLKDNRLQSHMIRIGIILLLLFALQVTMLGQTSWSKEKAVEDWVQSMEMPPAKVVSEQVSPSGYHGILLIDETHGMYHTVHLERQFLFWTNHGGTVSMPIKPDVLLSFRHGMTTLSQNKYLYYYLGQVSDPKIKRLAFYTELEGEQPVDAQSGIYQVVKEYSKQDVERGSLKAKLRAYDTEDQLIYELGIDDIEIRRSQQ